MIGLFDRPGPRWFAIPPHRPFLEDLASGLWRELTAQGPEDLPRAVVFLPTRRAGRGLSEAFLTAAGGRAVLLPQIRVLGDLDEGEPPFEPGDLALDLPPPISAERRRFELAGLIAEHQELIARRLDAEGALELADALGAFLDSCQLEERCDAAAVAALAEGELARHWAISANFLTLALEAWPARLEALGMSDPQARRVRLLRRLADRWTERPPSHPVVLAGSTGSTPAAADLMSTIAGLPMGCVVLPGLDMALAESAWAEVGEAHPQGAMKRLLARAGLDRGDIEPWDLSAESEAAGRWRRRLINEALRPPESTADWLPLIGSIRDEGAVAGVDPIVEGLEGLRLVTARDEEDAAAVIAVMMREALETPELTCALITPDVGLARRVSVRLTRWGIEADVSAGRPLAATPVATLSALLARAVAHPMDPALLLALLKHPMTRLNLGLAELAAARRRLERSGLRGPRPADWPALEARLDRARREGGADGARDRSIDAAADLARRARALLEALAVPFADGAAPVAAAAAALAEGLETICQGTDGESPWIGPAGEATAALLASMIHESGALPGATAAGFADLFEGLLARQVLRAGPPAHPRLKILGVLEARLTHADRLILAGLEEGVWPPTASADPFLSRPMRERLGLPPPERRIGLSAHDFAQAAAAPDVVLVNTERRGGAPAVASRWLWRLRTLARGAGFDPAGRPDAIAWARALDAPLAAPPAELAPARRPRPTPPLAARPRELPVTAIERWVRDPYGLYARHILGLRPLDPPDAPVEALARGTATHAAFERFAREHPDLLPDDAEAQFARLLIEALGEAGMPPAALARERALATNLAPWVVRFERERREGARVVVETQGRTAIDGPLGSFTLTARADRIEVRGGQADILDFKTGAAPSRKMVEAGLSPQLTLTAAILAAGGFEALGPLSPRELVYVRVSGGRVPGRVENRASGDANQLAAAALAGLARRVAHFDRPETGYLSRAAMQFVGGHGDYDHLARVWEWHVIGEGEGEPA
ncbi:MAG TPA: double-strand break repair protein AddB [Caulobacteraceae bacterium]|nr:double-strand break repair protein AddB [Caulobacteraceae bacterium]